MCIPKNLHLNTEQQNIIRAGKLVDNSEYVLNYNKITNIASIWIVKGTYEILNVFIEHKKKENF